MLNYEFVKNKQFAEVTQTYTQRDTMLYALGLGVGQDPMERSALRYVYEKELVAIPTLAAVLAPPAMWLRDPEAGVDYLKLVHGEQDIRFFKPLPAAGTVIGRARVVSATDKGAGKGAVLVQARELFDQATGEKLAEVSGLSFLRGDGGFSEKDGRSDAAPAALPAVPDRPADIEVSYTPRPEAALIYRLSGDYNPLHADPDIATKAGFERPILHGLCTYGIGARAVLDKVLNGDVTRLKRLAVRFTSPVFPGETIRYELWRESDTLYRMRASIDARKVVAMNNCVVEIA